MLDIDIRPVYRERATGALWRLNPWRMPTFLGRGSLPPDGDLMERVTTGEQIEIPRSERVIRFEAVRMVVTWEPCRDDYPLPPTPPTSRVEDDCG